MAAIKQFRIAHISRDQAGNVIYRYGTWTPGDAKDKRIEVTFDDTGKRELIAPEEMQLLGADETQRIKVGIISKTSSEMRTGWIQNGKSQAGKVSVLIDGTNEPCQATSEQIHKTSRFDPLIFSLKVCLSNSPEFDNCLPEWLPEYSGGATGQEWQ